LNGFGVWVLGINLYKHVLYNKKGQATSIASLQPMYPCYIPVLGELKGSRS